jgi:hypothetical protein
VITASVPAAGAKVADISDVMTGHAFCSQDPGAYGLSIVLRDKTSQAPFHPTTTGKKNRGRGGGSAGQVDGAPLAAQQ